MYRPESPSHNDELNSRMINLNDPSQVFAWLFYPITIVVRLG
jgi:hypothetical protein